MDYQEAYVKAKEEADKWKQKYFKQLKRRIDNGETLYNEEQVDWMIEHPRSVPSKAFRPIMRI